MKRNGSITLIVLLLIAAGMAALLIMQETEDTSPQSISLPTSTPIPDAQLVFPEINASDIQAIRLEDPNTDYTLTIARADEGDWQFLDRDYEPDQTVGDQLALTLANLPYYDTFASEGDLTQYGFLPTGSLMFIQFVLFNGTEHFLIIGNPVSEEADQDPGRTNTFYTIVDERPEIYLVSRPAVAFLIVQLQNS